MLYAENPGAVRPTHQEGDDVHPGFTTTPPPMTADAVFRCVRCNTEHIADYVTLGKKLFGAAESPIALDLDPHLGKPRRKTHLARSRWNR
jgi:hypothetical protein